MQATIQDCNSEDGGDQDRGNIDWQIQQLAVSSMTNRKQTDPAMMVELQVHGKKTRSGKFKVDTGADANVIPLNTLHMLAPHATLEPTDWTLSTYSSQPIKVLGTTNLKISSTRIKNANLEFIVVDKGAASVIGWNSAINQLQLVKQLFTVSRSRPNQQNGPPATSKWTAERLEAQFPDVFRGLGCMNQAYKIQQYQRSNRRGKFLLEHFNLFEKNWTDCWNAIL